MNYYYPFGEIVHPLIQQDRTPKKVFVLGVYASAVHARWKIGSKTICPAMAVASEPRIFWDGNPEEAAEIISRIHLPEGLGWHHWASHEKMPGFVTYCQKQELMPGRQR